VLLSVHQNVFISCYYILNYSIYHIYQYKTIERSILYLGNAQTACNIARVSLDTAHLDSLLSVYKISLGQVHAGDFRSVRADEFRVRRWRVDVLWTCMVIAGDC